MTAFPTCPGTGRKVIGVGTGGRRPHRGNATYAVCPVCGHRARVAQTGSPLGPYPVPPHPRRNP